MTVGAKKIPGPSTSELAEARSRYREIESLDLFYRVATQLVADVRLGKNQDLTLGEALAVLLYTWNQSYYRFRPPGASHVTDLEALLDGHSAELAALASLRLEDADDHAMSMAGDLFSTFESLLGPVGAAKALHLLQPRFFPIWDRTIAWKYGVALGPVGTNGDRYIAFMSATAAQCRQVARHRTAPADALKALDEWNYVTYTRPKLR